MARLSRTTRKPEFQAEVRAVRLAMAKLSRSRPPKTSRDGGAHCLCGSQGPFAQRDLSPNGAVLPTRHHNPSGSPFVHITPCLRDLRQQGLKAGLHGHQRRSGNFTHCIHEGRREPGLKVHGRILLLQNTCWLHEPAACEQSRLRAQGEHLHVHVLVEALQLVEVPLQAGQGVRVDQRGRGPTSCVDEHHDKLGFAAPPQRLACSCQPRSHQQRNP